MRRACVATVAYQRSVRCRRVVSAMAASAGARFRAALAAAKPLQIVGAINAYHAKQAEQIGARPFMAREGLRTLCERRACVSMTAPLGVLVPLLVSLRAPSCCVRSAV